MAVKMRLKRMGQKKAPFYRIIIPDLPEMADLSRKSDTMIRQKTPA